MATENGKRKKLGEYLLEAGLINDQQLKEALRLYFRRVLGK